MALRVGSDVCGRKKVDLVEVDVHGVRMCTGPASPRARKLGRNRRRRERAW